MRKRAWTCGVERDFGSCGAPKSDFGSCGTPKTSKTLASSADTPTPFVRSFVRLA